MNTTPVLDLVGVYSLTTPFEVEEGAIYQCTSITSIKGLLVEGVDVYGSVYAPQEIAQEAYVDDVKANVNIVKLVSTTGHPTITVPASYIESVPDLSVVDYKRHMVTVDLGLMAAGSDLSMLKETIKENALHQLGITPTFVDLTVAPKNTISKDDADRLETAREAAKSYKRTDKATIAYWMNRALENETYIARLEEALVNAGTKTP